MYSDAPILLLDDPLSALDHQTAELIVQSCFKSSLAVGRTIVLVTHRTGLCMDAAEQIVQISEGKARVIRHIGVNDSEVHDLSQSHTAAEEHSVMIKAIATDAPSAQKFIEDEARAEGGIQLPIYWTYIRAGKLKWWTILIIILGVYRLVAVGETWFLKQWVRV